MHCQDVSSFGNAPVKMCRLSAGGLVCVLSFYFCPKCIVKMCRLSAMHLSRCRLSAGGLVCVFFLFISALNALLRCVVFRQCTCQDVSSFGRGSCVCVLSFYFCPKCIVKMCRLSAMHLSRCVVFRQGVLCVCVLSFYFCPKCIVKMCRLSPMHLSRYIVFRQGVLCVCVCMCVCPFFLFLP